MKIGILVTIMNGFGKKGFYQSQEVGLGKKLTQRGHEVVVYKGVKEPRRREETLSDRLSIHYIPMRALGVHGYVPVSEIDPGLDAMLCFSDTQLFLPHVYRFCIKNNIVFVPYIGIAHSAQKNLKSKLMDMAFRAGTLKIYKENPVLVKSASVKDEMEQMDVTDCRIVPVGMDDSVLRTDFEKADRRALRSELGFEDGDTVISFVGRMKSEKQPLEAVEMFNRIKDRKQFRMVMVGEGYLDEEIRQLIWKYDLEDKVKFLGRVPYEDIWKIHYAADYYINFCDREIFGMALLEAVYYRSSVAALHAPGPDAILTGEIAHRLCADIHEAEEWLLAPYPGEKALKAASDSMLKRFSWEICADAIEEITAGRKNN